MAHTFFDNADSAIRVVGTQSAIVGSATASVVDITGCSVTVGAGTWLLFANFSTARFWVSSSGYNGGYMYYAIRKSDGTTYQAAYKDIYFSAPSPARVEFHHSLTAIVTPTASTTYKMSGYTALVYGTNFASGFRSDSGVGLASTLTAVKVAS